MKQSEEGIETAPQPLAVCNLNCYIRIVISLIINCGTTTMSWKHDSFTWQCVQFLFYTLYNLSIITTRQVCSTYTLVKQCVTDKHHATHRQIKSHTTSRMVPAEWPGTASTLISSSASINTSLSCKASSMKSGFISISIPNMRDCVGNASPR